MRRGSLKGPGDVTGTRGPVDPITTQTACCRGANERLPPSQTRLPNGRLARSAPRPTPTASHVRPISQPRPETDQYVGSGGLWFGAGCCDRGTQGQGLLAAGGKRGRGGE